MASRLVQRHKKSTILVTERTLNQAMTEARAMVQMLGHDDPRSEELKQLYNQIAQYARGKGGTEFYDDAVNPEIARQLKEAVDKVLQMRTEVNQPATAPATQTQQAPVKQMQMQPAMASAKSATNLSCDACEKGGFKDKAALDGHMATDHKKAAKETSEAPMSSRLFARKKKHVEAEDEELLDAAPEAVAGDAPAEPLPDAGMDAGAPPVAPAAPAAPAVAPPTAGNSFANLPTEALTAVAEALTKVEAWEMNPAILGAIEQVAEELKNRPMQPAADPNAPRTASKKVSDAIKLAVAPEGWEGTVKDMKKDKSISNPYALANWMKGEGYTPHKASFMIKRGRGPWLQAKFAAASNVPPVNEDTLNKVDSQPHEVKEIGEAHGDRSGVAEAEKHDGHPGVSVTTVKSPQDMEKQAAAETSEVGKALKTAEALEKKLGEMYMDAKPICRANASAAVRDAVESIYDAKNKFAEAKKVLNRHEMQAAAEEEAQEKALDKGKKASANTLGLVLVGAE